MKKAIYGTYRPERLSNHYDLGNVTLNGTYTPSMFLNSMFGDWNALGLTNVVDNSIDESRYVAELSPGIRKLTRFLMCEYEDSAVNPEEFARSVKNCGARWNIDTFQTPEEASAWLRSNTDLVEEAPGKFLVKEAGTDMFGNATEAVYLEIS